MPNSTQFIQKYAKVGALARLNELKAEIADIERAFPGLGGPRAGGPRASAETDLAAPKRRTRKPMSAAQKKAVGARMKKYWAERRKAGGAKKR